MSWLKREKYRMAKFQVVRMWWRHGARDVEARKRIFFPHSSFLLRQGLSGQRSAQEVAGRGGQRGAPQLAVAVSHPVPEIGELGRRSWRHLGRARGEQRSGCGRNRLDNRKRVIDSSRSWEQQPGDNSTDTCKLVILDFLLSVSS